jgi:serine phosphatase RsbU (regulator of sigma subunit)
VNLTYLEISVCAAAIATALYVFINNIFVRRTRHAENFLVGGMALIAMPMFGLIIFLLLSPGSIFGTDAARMYFACVSLVTQIYMHFAQVVPRWEKRSPLWLIIVTAIPGIVLFFVTILTPYIILAAQYSDNSISFVFGNYYYLYLAVYFTNLFTCTVIINYKNRILENDSFRIQLFYRSLGENIGAAIAVGGFIILPYFFSIQRYHALSMAGGGIVLLIISNYAISDDRLLDFMKFYSRIAFRVTIFLILLVPAFYLISLGADASAGGKGVPGVATALGIFAYFFLFYRFGAPRLERLARRRYIQFERNVNEFFQGITSVSEMKDQAGFWDVFFSNTIDALRTRFAIENAAFFMYRAKDGGYLYNYGFGGEIDLRAIEETGELVRCLKEFPGILEKSLLFTDDRLKDYRSSLKMFFSEHNILVVLPFYNIGKQLIGLLLLGNLTNKQPYSMDMLSVLDIYRIHFEVSLTNSIFLEDIKEAKIAEHDRLVMQNVKGRIMPKSMQQIEGLRTSSLYLNNSEVSTDFFDSVVVKPDRLGVFVGSTTNAGIHSLTLALEMFSVLHAHAGSYESPEKIMNLLNWVVTTSRFSDAYAPCYYFVFNAGTRTISYSNAAMRPLTIFDYERETFSELDTKGIPIGLDRTFVYESKTLHVSPGSIGIIYSQGLESQLDDQGASYSVGRIKDLVRLNKDDSPAILVRKVLADLRNFSKEAVQTQDVSLVIFKAD